METQAAINHRRAIRDFQSTPVPQADLIDIVRDAQRTPSWGGNSQPGKFISLLATVWQNTNAGFKA